MKVISLVGTRPQIIKLFPVSLALRHHQEVIIHTGQHYDNNMSAIFWQELGMVPPHYHLKTGSGSHAEQTGHMLIEIEKILIKEKPDLIIVFGDTNTTLAGALAAAKLQIPIAHIEAGLRSYNRNMPEEINRIMTDHLSHWLFCPTDIALQNLTQEGKKHHVYNVGDVMFDAALLLSAKAEKNVEKLLNTIQVSSKKYLLATIHRPANTDSIDALASILNILANLHEPIIFPVHPRTRKAIQMLGLKLSKNIQMIDPLGYLDMLALEKNARMILTDSGGVQKEAFFFRIPCLTLRTETEWLELVKSGWNRVVGLDKEQIINAVENWKPSGEVFSHFYGEGQASSTIIKILENN